MAKYKLDGEGVYEQVKGCFIKVITKRFTTIV